MIRFFYFNEDEERNTGHGVGRARGAAWCELIPEYCTECKMLRSEVYQHENSSKVFRIFRNSSGTGALPHLGFIRPVSPRENYRRLRPLFLYIKRMEWMEFGRFFFASSSCRILVCKFENSFSLLLLLNSTLISVRLCPFIHPLEQVSVHT